MTGPAQVSTGDTIRWLYSEGLARLAGVAGRLAAPISAYTVEVASGTVVAHPATGVGLGSDAMSLAADDLPFPMHTAKRLLVVGVTTAASVLVVDLAEVEAVAINAERPEEAARSWVMQLLLNPEVTITTNSATVTIDDTPRCRHIFIPGAGATLITVDDKRPPITTITLNASNDGPDHLDVAADGTGEMYLGARYWQLSHCLMLDETAWAAWAAQAAQLSDIEGTAVDAPGASETTGEQS
ncbi:hypothetical protein [Nocardia colli]|uniref:hypothetical protein n=1 Tax=Nocardia colli TaxID=2545717 RepID=UPI00168D4CD0|nr:hypothetical protein [Nocardia colli]